MGNNLFGDDGKGKFNILIPVHRCVVVFFLMSIVRNRALGVYTVLLSRHLVVARLAQDVVATPEKSSFSPPTVTQTMCVSVLWDWVLATSCE